MVDPADEKEQRKVEAAIDAASSAFEISLLEIIAERLGTIEDLSLAEVFALMAEDSARIRKAVEDGARNINNTAASAMAGMAKANDEWAAKYYQARNIEQQSAFTHSTLKNKLEKNTDRLKGKVTALCRSSVVGIGDRKTYLPVEQSYRRIISTAATEMTSEELTNQEAIAEAVRELSRSGVRVQYQSGVTRDLVTSVRTNVMDAYRTTLSDMREIQGAEFGADGVEVSAHALCAPDHQDYQGMQYSLERKRGYELWDDIQYEPDRPLVTGANCGHTVFPVILGVSSGAYTRKELQELKRLSNELVSFKGLSGETLTMSRYNASQYQRRIETTIRKQKRETYLLEKANLPNFAKMERKTQRELTARYKSISEAMGLTPRLENTRIFAPK